MTSTKVHVQLSYLGSCSGRRSRFNIPVAVCRVLVSVVGLCSDTGEDAVSLSPARWAGSAGDSDRLGLGTPRRPSPGPRARRGRVPRAGHGLPVQTSPVTGTCPWVRPDVANASQSPCSPAGPGRLCCSVTHGAAAALFNSVRLLFPRFPVFPLQPAHCAVSYGSWVECFRLKCNFSAFKSLWRFFFFFPLKRTATPTRDNLMDYSAGLRGSP